MAQGAIPKGRGLEPHSRHSTAAQPRVGPLRYSVLLAYLVCAPPPCPRLAPILPLLSLLAKAGSDLCPWAVLPAMCRQGTWQWPNTNTHHSSAGMIQFIDALAERSKAVAHGAIPKGRGLEPRRRQMLNVIYFFSEVAKKLVT